MMMVPLGHTLVIHRRITRHVPFLQLECNLMGGDMDFFSNSSVSKGDVQWVPDNGYGKYQKHTHTYTLYPLSQPQLPNAEQGEHRIQEDPHSSVSYEQLAPLSFYPLLQNRNKETPSSA